MSAPLPASAELLERARAHGSAGEHAAVVRLLEGLPAPDLLAEPELGYHLAYAWRRTGNATGALDLAERLATPVRRSGAEWLIRRRLNLEAMLRFDHGDIAGAEQLWAEVVAHSSAAGDDALLAAAHNNLGIVATLQDRVESALAAFQRALLANRRLGDRRGMAQAHQNLAITFRELARPVEADAHFQQALREARAAGSEDVRGRAEEERALLLLEQGDALLAEATAQRALDRLAGIGDANGEGEALRVLGIIALRQRRSSDARARLGRALDLAQGSRNALLEAETREALAILEHLQGNPVAAATQRRLATARFSAMRAEPWGARIRSRTTSLTGG